MSFALTPVAAESALIEIGSVISIEPPVCFSVFALDAG